MFLERASGLAFDFFLGFSIVIPAVTYLACSLLTAPIAKQAASLLRGISSTRGFEILRTSTKMKERHGKKLTAGILVPCGSLRRSRFDDLHLNVLSRREARSGSRSAISLGLLLASRTLLGPPYCVVGTALRLGRRVLHLTSHSIIWKNCNGLPPYSSW